MIRNRLRVSPSCWPRAAYATLSTPLNSTAAAICRRQFKSEWEMAQVSPPIFLLGHWRSGTTHLQRLFALDRRFGYPTMYECLGPRAFLLLEDSTVHLYDRFMPADRVFDRMSNSFSDPGEDEFALAILCGLSPCLAWLFPRNRASYDRFLTFRDATARERETWKESLATFLKMLTVRWKRPIVLKSPGHTARIKLLLELFPDARFVHIHRDPYRVFSSTCNMVRFQQTLGFQRMQPDGVEEMTIDWYRAMHESFFEERALVASDRFVDVSYAELVERPHETMDRIYGGLSLGSLDHQALADYLASVADHETNRFAEVASPWRERINAEWKRSFEEWGYPVRG